jgi:hypothetical protein
MTYCCKNIHPPASQWFESCSNVCLYLVFHFNLICQLPRLLYRALLYSRCKFTAVFRVCKFLHDCYSRYLANSVNPRIADCVKMAVYVYPIIISKQMFFSCNSWLLDIYTHKYIPYTSGDCLQTNDLLLHIIVITCFSFPFTTSLTYLLTYSVALVRKWTIPTERPPLVGEVSAYFCR